jgi:hypothetical protein
MPDKIYTDEALIAYDIFTKISDAKAQTLFYQCLFHIEVFTEASQQLKEAKEKLDFHNFARSQSCHMTDGIFGVDKHSSQMETAKIKTLGYLGITISSGHKFLRSLKNARNKERGISWKPIKKQLVQLEDDYRLARNACEHLDESINKDETSKLEDFSFSINNVLRFKHNSVAREFDFSPQALSQVTDYWNQTLTLLRAK